MQVSTSLVLAAALGAGARAVLRAFVGLPLPVGVSASIAAATDSAAACIARSSSVVALSCCNLHWRHAACHGRYPQPCHITLDAAACRSSRPLNAADSICRVMWQGGDGRVTTAVKRRQWDTVTSVLHKSSVCSPDRDCSLHRTTSQAPVQCAPL